LKRRQFLTSIGAISAAIPESRAADATSTARVRTILNGRWDRQVNGVPVDYVEVPSSLRPSGYYTLKRSFSRPRISGGERTFVHFEAINYHGRVSVNGTELGVTIPYVPAEFECTKQVRPGTNAIAVDIADLCAAPNGAGADEVWLGVNPGWEGYGGIIRDAWIETRPGSFLNNVRLSYRLSPDFRNAQCRLTVWLSAASSSQGQCEVSLVRGQSEVARANKQITIPQGESTAEIEFAVDNPALWSPNAPNLYGLHVRLKSNSGSDEWTCNTGFRHTAIRGRSFLLNGEPIILNGVCRHDMWHNQGFTLSRVQMQQDMRAIKAMGTNFIRLVHYPHDRYIIELADELGMLVSEEPGYWNVDFRKMPWPRAALGLRIMERTARRDWNSPSVFAWLLANESHATVEYLSKGKEMFKDLDPLGRFVSMANSMKKEDAKPVCEQSGMDFFDDHPYTFDIAEFDKIAAFYGPGKPLLFTEWGGREIGQSDIIMPNTVDKLIDMVQNGSLAGHCFWSWQDLPQFSRIDPEMREGILESGIVTEGREPREFVYSEMTRLFEQRRRAGNAFVDAAAMGPVVVPLHQPAWQNSDRIQQIDLSGLITGDRGKKAWDEFENLMAAHWKSLDVGQWDRTGRRFRLWREPELDLLGVRVRFPLADGGVRPVVLTPGSPSFEVPVGKICTALHFLGQVTCPGGFPLVGTPGDTVATYTVRYEKGQTRDIPVRAGFEVAAANAIHAATRIDPVASGAQRAFWYIKDWAREHYQALLFSVTVERGLIQSVRCDLHPQQPPFFIYAMLTESA
jgi:hypothetical protein